MVVERVLIIFQFDLIVTWFAVRRPRASTFSDIQPPRRSHVDTSTCLRVPIPRSATSGPSLRCEAPMVAASKTERKSHDELF